MAEAAVKRASLRGRFITFEGGEGSGKSTQIALAAAWARARGRTVVETREPGGTALGVELRGLVLDPDGHVTPRAEALIYAADRAHHVDTVVVPALDRGELVLSDRYVDSTLAYQGAGRDLVPGEVERIARWATADLRPDLTVLLDVEPAVGLSRFDAPDRLEAEPVTFHERVRQSFLALAAEDRDHYLVVDARLDRDQIASTVRDRLRPVLARASRPARADR
jgi:dTMP kinase